MNKLDKKLSLWKQNNLISSEQMLSIKNFETKNHKNYLLYALVSLGIFIIFLGIISIISANWYEINDIYKLAAEFIILFTLSMVAFITFNRNNISLFEIQIFLLWIEMVNMVFMI